MADTIIDKLLKLQDQDRRIKQIDTEAQEIPLRKSRLTNRLESQHQIVQTANESHMRLQAGIKDIELDIDLSREKINRYRKQQMEVKDNESYRALDNEIRGLTRHIRQQEDNEIGLMEELETVKAQLEVEQAELDRQIKEVGSEEAALDDKFTRLDTELVDLRHKRETLTDGIDEDWLSRYVRTFQHLGDYALVRSNGGTCAGCHMQIPPALVLASKKGEKISTCNYCGRMLYFEI